MPRPSWDQTFMMVAEVIARRSRCSKTKVAAVIVTSDNRIASTGYNGPSAGLILNGECKNWCPRARGEGGDGQDYSACMAVHAEANALARADFSAIQGGTIYVSRACCINCARQISNAGLRQIVHQVTPDDLHRKPGEVEAYIKECGLKVVRVETMT